MSSSWQLWHSLNSSSTLDLTEPSVCLLPLSSRPNRDKWNRKPWLKGTAETRTRGSEEERKAEGGGGDGGGGSMSSNDGRDDDVDIEWTEDSGARCWTCVSRVRGEDSGVLQWLQPSTPNKPSRPDRQSWGILCVCAVVSVRNRWHSGWVTADLAVRHGPEGDLVECWKLIVPPSPPPAAVVMTWHDAAVHTGFLPHASPAPINSACVLVSRKEQRRAVSVSTWGAWWTCVYFLSTLHSLVSTPHF